MSTGPGVRTRGLRTDASPEEQECAILAAATFEFSDVGVRRANMDLVARRARISRSTLYRRFPSKEHLLTAVMQQACDQITAQISLRVEGLGLRETIVEAFRVALTEVEQNGLLRRIITEEVGTVETVFGFLGDDVAAVIETFSTGVARALRTAGATMSDADLRIAAELLVRLCTSLLQAPSPAIDFSDDVAVTRFGEKFLTPLVW